MIKRQNLLINFDYFNSYYFRLKIEHSHQLINSTFRKTNINSFLKVSNPASKLANLAIIIRSKPGLINGSNSDMAALRCLFIRFLLTALLWTFIPTTTAILLTAKPFLASLSEKSGVKKLFPPLKSFSMSFDFRSLCSLGYIKLRKMDALLLSGLDNQSLASLCLSSLQYVSAALCAHSSPKSVYFYMFSFFRLICPFWHKFINLIIIKDSMAILYSNFIIIHTFQQFINILSTILQKTCTFYAVCDYVIVT